MDCNMPYLDGYQATSKLREILYEKDIAQPIVTAVTGHTELSYIERAYDSGMNQVFQKPVKPDLLKKLIDEYF